MSDPLNYLDFRSSVTLADGREISVSYTVPANHDFATHKDVGEAVEYVQMGANAVLGVVLRSDKQRRDEIPPF